MARSPVAFVVLSALLVGCVAPGYKSIPWGEDTTTTTGTTTGDSSTGSSSTSGGSSSTSGGDSDGTSTSSTGAPDTTTTSAESTVDPSSTTGAATTIDPSTTGAPGSCGDGVVDPGEECDDGDLDGSDGCNQVCARDRFVFVTSEMYQPWQIGGALMADARCRQLAGKARLPNWQSYIAWISDSEHSVVSRLFPGQGRYLRVDNAVVADDLPSLLAGPLKAPIRVDENGLTLDGGGAWTGTNADGTAAPGMMCHDWSMNDFMVLGQWGSTQSTDSTWAKAPLSEPCVGTSRMYCFEGK